MEIINSKVLTYIYVNIKSDLTISTVRVNDISSENRLNFQITLEELKTYSIKELDSLAENLIQNKYSTIYDTVYTNLNEKNPLKCKLNEILINDPRSNIIINSDDDFDAIANNFRENIQVFSHIYQLYNTKCLNDNDELIKRFNRAIYSIKEDNLMLVDTQENDLVCLVRNYNLLKEFLTNNNLWGELFGLRGY